MTDTRITTATTWYGWQIVSPRCYGCIHSVVTSDRAVCYCKSRTIRNGVRGDICDSYWATPGYATKNLSLCNDAKVVDE